MGRPPCCDKEGVKKGPWTPEEDIMLVTYVQEHGPGNWRAVPTHTGLRRCSKSCRLRWTNYLRPGIKRGSFTDHEEKLIIQLQALLGNKWAAIASYLPERTDNDVKNYWNTHLKKKLKKLHESPDHDLHGHDSSRAAAAANWLSTSTSQTQSISRGQWEKRLQTDINKAKQALHDALSLDYKKLPSCISPPTLVVPADHDEYLKPSYSSSYASSTDNIARLLKGWMKEDSPAATKASQQTNFSSTESNDQNSFDNTDSAYSEGALSASKTGTGTGTGIDLSESLESFFCLDTDFSSQPVSHETSLLQGDDERKPDIHDDQVSSPMFDNWFFAEGGTAAVQGKEELTNFSFDENAEFILET